MDRRAFVSSTASGTAGLVAGSLVLNSDLLALDAVVDRHRVTELHIAPFRFDVTPPLGHGCCGNWIKPIEGYDDAHEAIGLVIMGAGKPIVVCSVDWTGILNQAHVQWREAIADAAGTTSDRVAVQVVHQHNAPLACLEAAKLVSDQGDLPHVLNVDYFHRCLDAARTAIKQAMFQGERVTHIGSGQARVVDVAANRRILGPNGKVRASRSSSCTDPELRALPDGLIDPFLKSIAFYAGERKLAACHYYACHPMSYYGDGRASSDYCGLARKRRQGEEAGCTHIYFNGCGGNIGAGKYNDGSPKMRPILASRIYDAIVAADKAMSLQPISSVSWSTCEFLPKVDSRWDEEKLLAQIHDKKQAVVNRSRPAYTVAWIRRVNQRIPVVLSSLHINDVSIVHFPGAPFVEFQLHAQQHHPARFVATAGYGDGGPWYLPTAEAYPQLGYEVSVAWSAPDADQELRNGMQQLLSIG